MGPAVALAAQYGFDGADECCFVDILGGMWSGRERRLQSAAWMCAVALTLLPAASGIASAGAESSKRWKTWKKDLDYLYETIGKESSLKQIFKVKGIKWKAVVKEANKRFKAASSAGKKRKKDDQRADELAFYGVLRYVVGQLRDSHAYVSAADEINEAWRSAQPKVCDAGIELCPGAHGVVIVANTRAARNADSPLLSRGVQYQQTIVESINGEPALEFLSTQAQRMYVEDGWQSTLSRALSDAGNALKVPEDEPLKFVFRTLDISDKARDAYLKLPPKKRAKALSRFKWKKKKVTLRSAECAKARNPRNFSFMALERAKLEKTTTKDVWYRKLASGIGYVGYFKVSKSSREGLRQACEALEDCPGLILDIRWNGGGGDGNVQMFDKRKGSWDKPLAVLIGPRSFSAAETDIWMLQQMRDGKRTNARFFGRKTAGASGDKIRFKLPSGFAEGRFVFRHWHGGRSKIEGHGLDPDEVVLQDVVELSAGIDSCIRAAEVWIAEQGE